MTVTAAILAIGTASAAAAQDVRVQVDVRIPPIVVRDIERLTQSAIAGKVAGEIRRAVNDVIGGLVDARREFGRSAAQRDYRAVQTDRESRTLQLGANGALELRNLAGDISVAAGSGHDTIVEIVRTSHGRTDADARLGLGRVTVVVDQRGDRATIRSVYPNESRAPYSVETSYHVTAPAGTRVSVNSLSAGVSIRGIKGDIAVMVTSGGVEISDASRISAVKTVSGDITITGADMADGTLAVGSISGDLVIQQVKARRLEASSVSGTVTARDVAAENVLATSMNGTVTYAGPLAREGRYQLQTHSGTVHLVPSGSTGFELQANTFSGDIRTDMPVQLQGPVTGRGPRRAVHGTVGDGSAIVILTTFSGSIVVGK